MARLLRGAVIDRHDTLKLRLHNVVMVKVLEQAVMLALVADDPQIQSDGSDADHQSHAAADKCYNFQHLLSLSPVVERNVALDLEVRAQWVGLDQRLGCESLDLLLRTDRRLEHHLIMDEQERIGTEVLDRFD